VDGGISDASFWICKKKEKGKSVSNRQKKSPPQTFLLIRLKKSASSSLNEAISSAPIGRVKEVEAISVMKWSATKKKKGNEKKKKKNLCAYSKMLRAGTWTLTLFLSPMW
jgi:hypothetical protein